MPYAYTVQGRTIELTLDRRVIAVRFREGQPLTAWSRAARAWSAGEPDGGVEIPDDDVLIVPSKFLQTNAEAATEEEFATAMRHLGQQPDILHVWPVFKVGRYRVFATNRLIIGLNQEARSTDLCHRHGLRILEVRDDKIVCEASGAADPFAPIADLERESDVRFVEPDFVSIGNRADSAGPPGSDRPGRHPTAGEQETATAGHVNDDDGGLAAWGDHQAAIADLAESIGNSRKRMERDGVDGHLMAVRVTPTQLPGGRQKTTNTIIARSINWARRSGADIMTHGWVGGLPSNDIIEEFERAQTLGRDGLGCVMVVAPEHDDDQAEFPATLPNVLTLSGGGEPREPAKVGRTGHVWRSSRRQSDARPSLAATTLSGACALILAANPDLTEAEVRELVAWACLGASQPRHRSERDGPADRRRLNVLGAVRTALAVAQ